MPLSHAHHAVLVVDTGLHCSLCQQGGCITAQVMHCKGNPKSKHPMPQAAEQRGVGWLLWRLGGTFGGLKCRWLPDR